MRGFKYVCAMVLVACWLAGAQIRAEDAGTGGPPPDGTRRQWNPDQMMQRLLERIKETLAVSDEDWKALQPKVEAVQKLVSQARMSMFTRRRGGNDDAAQQPKSEVEQKTQELRTLLENKDADPKEVKAKTDELRVAREKAKLELKKAQDELKELLTQRQEAQLVLMGLLD